MRLLALNPRCIVIVTGSLGASTSLEDDASQCSRTSGIFDIAFSVHLQLQKPRKQEVAASSKRFELARIGSESRTKRKVTKPLDADCQWRICTSRYKSKLKTLLRWI